MLGGVGGCPVLAGLESRLLTVWILGPEEVTQIIIADNKGLLRVALPASLIGGLLLLCCLAFIATNLETRLWVNKWVTQNLPVVCKYQTMLIFDMQLLFDRNAAPCFVLSPWSFPLSIRS